MTHPITMRFEKHPPIFQLECYRQEHGYDKYTVEKVDKLYHVTFSNYLFIPKRSPGGIFTKEGFEEIKK